MANTRIVLADDELVVREALTRLIAGEPNLQLVGVAVDTPGAVALAAGLKPDLAILDVSMPGGGGAEAARNIQLTSPGTRVVALSSHTDCDTVLAMIAAGAVGYVVKGAPRAEIVDTIERCARGESRLAAEITGGVVGELARRLEETRSMEDTIKAQHREVRGLIDGERLRIVLQPIADLRTGAFVGAEALARFPDGRTPVEWFAEAEGVGLREDLELLAARAAIKERSALPDGAFLAVNLSPDVAVAKASVLTHAAGPGLVIEVTEHAAIDDYSVVHAAFDGVRGDGTRFAIDDVGAGFASLRHILQLRPELIKIDASLTNGVEHDRTRRALALGLTAFADEFGAMVVAEGIESEAELRALRAIGITYGQGYHIARPTAASKLPEWKGPV